MALPAWPAVPYAPQTSGFQPVQSMLPPIVTEMEGGNTRQRPRPGDNVGTVKQTIRMTFAQTQIFQAWVKDTLNLGTARFTTNVWMGSAFANKVCQFMQAQTPIGYAYIAEDIVDVSMQLKVYDV